MADPSVDILASDLFAMHANFNPQPNTTTVALDEKTTLDAYGNGACSRTTGDITEVTQSFTYCGSDFMTDIGTFLTEFGNVQNSQVITSLAINMTAADYATVDITGHNHTTNAHAAGLAIGHADVSGALPDGVGEAFENWDGFGVPDFEVGVGSNSTPASATITFTMNHVDEYDEAGDHFVGKNITPRSELTMDFTGIPTSNTPASLEVVLSAPTGAPDWYVTSTDSNESNEEFDTFAFSAYSVDYALATS